MLPGWCGAYVGLPYRHGGRGPDAYDCWGLVALVLRRQFGITVPDYAEDTPAEATDRAAMARAVEAHSGAPWVRIAHRPSLRDPLIWQTLEQPGDVVLMRRLRWPCHVGIVVAPDSMLHTEERVDAAVAPIRGGRDAATLVAIYRHRDLL